MIRNHSRHGSRFPITLGGGGYSVNKSLRFRSSASASLNRTPAVAGNRQIWTWSGWVKRGILSSEQCLISTRIDDNNKGFLSFTSGDSLYFLTNSGGPVTCQVTTSAVFRDPAAWYHVVVALDTTQATAANRVIIYINGISQSLTIATQVAQNASLNFNIAYLTSIGRQEQAPAPVSYFDGEQAEVNFVDGYPTGVTSGTWAATNVATIFGASSIYNQWLPIRYAGTYGANGFYLPFTNTTSTSTLVADSSGNGNNWTANNISLTAGSTYDSLTDVPTLTSTTVANYAVLNPLSTNQFGGSSTITNGNLTVAVPSSSASVAFATLPCSGKNYMETLGGSFGSGVLAVQCFSLSGLQGAGYYSDGRIFVNNVLVSTYATFTGADVISCDIDTSTRQIRFYKNNTQIGSTATATGTDALYFAVSGSGAGTGSPSTSMNFGQQPFTYTPPSGFLPLNTYNI